MPGEGVDLANAMRQSKSLVATTSLLLLMLSPGRAFPTQGIGANGKGISIATPRLVSIDAPDGVAVVADEYGASDRAVILAHGGRFDRTSWKEQAKALAAAGFRVLAIDFRAATASRQGKETPCLYDASCLAKDILAVVRYLRRDGAKHVSIVGGSLGGGAAAQATIEAKAGEIDQVVLLAHMLIDEPERMKGRKLFIVARNDLSGSGKPRLEGITAQFERSPDPKEMLILEGAAHAQFLFETDQGKRLLREILRFLSNP